MIVFPSVVTIQTNIMRLHIDRKRIFIIKKKLNDNDSNIYLLMVYTVKEMMKKKLFIYLKKMIEIQPRLMSDILLKLGIFY